MIANRSSGKQGFAIAGALAGLGARVTLVAGPVGLETPAGVEPHRRRDGRADGAAVRGGAARRRRRAGRRGRRLAGRARHRPSSRRKTAPPALDWQRTADILAGLAASAARPRLLVGFAAETANVDDEAAAKRTRKGADWIVANDVSGDVMGGDANSVHLITEAETESWERMSKAEVARRLAQRIAEALA